MVPIPKSRLHNFCHHLQMFSPWFSLLVKMIDLHRENLTNILIIAGGHLVFTVSFSSMSRGGADKLFEAAMQQFHDEGKWKWLKNEVVDDFFVDTFSGSSTKGHLYVFQKQ